MAEEATTPEDQPKEMLRKPEMIDRVITATGMKKKDVKPVLEAAFAVLGQALSDGEVLNLPPLGKVKVTQQKEVGNAEILVARIRRAGPRPEASEPSEEPAPATDDGAA